MLDSNIASIAHNTLGGGEDFASSFVPQRSSSSSFFLTTGSNALLTNQLQQYKQKHYSETHNQV